jgi:hypothetical protein
MAIELTPASKAPKLKELAAHCENGACNMYTLIHALDEAVSELRTEEIRDHPAVKMILGQLTYLCGETLGPTSEAIIAYNDWRDT